MATKPKEKKPVKQVKAGDEKKKRPGTFKKNDPITGEKDPRINRSGQNAKYTELHNVLDKILHEEQEVKIGQNTVRLQLFELVMRQWLLSGDYNKQCKALEYWAGKVPDELKIHSDIEEIVKGNIDLFTEGQMDRMLQGEAPTSLLIDLLSELRELRKKTKENES